VSLPQAYDIVDTAWLAFEGKQVVLPHPTRGLLLVPLGCLEEEDGEDFKKTHAKAAFRVVAALDGKPWTRLGRIKRVWEEFIELPSYK
jgi:hypothetical protein